MKCQVRVSNPQMKYLLTSLLIEDGTATRWVSAFDNVGSEFLGVSADQLSDQKKNQDDSGMIATLDKMLRKKYTAQEYKMRLKCKMEEYMGQLRPRVQILTARPVESELKED